MQKTLLALVEIGGYPDFSPLYQQAGYAVITHRTLRKALSYLKKNTPDIIVAEFNFQSDFRDRTSSLETLMSVIQKKPHTRLIIFYEKEYHTQFQRFSQRFPLYATFTFPIDTNALANALP